ncbi:hypothetical protein SAMN05421503_0330 [Terribacillus aidingensis]|uniref:DUF4190 domain-containing protein n=1 Tax=Terribacillus aidingensis TaxID=586416 RepID=A0A285N6I7_9BACI|nr:hypothetical protein [Terribacillus aidingensis]SNZ03321.1 hypothetical protein SAMN05421503_0330 [Terribacillus aidingensis]
MEQQQHTVVVTRPEGNGLAVTALVLGLIALVLCWVPFMPYPLAILAIIFGAIGAKKKIKKGLGITGVVTGIITILFKITFWVVLISAGASAA